ncbi:MAG: hypothetical protein K6G65_04870 [Lachnospiraceae bacterium]|nr:hypothetical protein [Lachnospiraceae bacterium]
MIIQNSVNGYNYAIGAGAPVGTVNHIQTQPTQEAKESSSKDDTAASLSLSRHLRGRLQFYNQMASVGESSHIHGSGTATEAKFVLQRLKNGMDSDETTTVAEEYLLQNEVASLNNVITDFNNIRYMSDEEMDTYRQNILEQSQQAQLAQAASITPELVMALVS